MIIVVPESILEAVEKAAQRRELSVSEFVEQSLLAKATEALSNPYLEARASRASGRGWSLLEKAPRIAPIEGDELP